jgi:hypothetical protein
MVVVFRKRRTCIVYIKTNKLAFLKVKILVARVSDVYGY